MRPVKREHILAEIRRTAEENGGKPLGRGRFAAATGIREGDWSGRYWARWGDAVREAGFEPNQLQGRYDDDLVLEKLVGEIRRFGKLPTEAELRLRRREDSSFPSTRVFERFGPKWTWAERVAAYCRERPDYADVLEMLAPLLEVKRQTPADDGVEDPPPGGSGFVYLLRSGAHYKIGWTRDVGRRRYDLAIQLPEPVTEEHVIATDDPIGIERYWHGRFGTRRKNGEWFELSRADVAAFKRRRFM